MKVSRSEFKMERVEDNDPDLSHLGEYGNTPKDGAIDRKERGDMGRNEFRYFYPAMTGEDTGNPESPEQDYKRMEAYNRGDWWCVGICATVELKIPSKQGGYWTLQTIKSPGLWGIESDSDDSYFEEVFKDECGVLAEMLEQIGMEVTD